MGPLLSKYQCQFRKGFSAQNSLLTMLEKWKSSEDKGKVFGVLLVDFSKAFGHLSHEIIFARLYAYGFCLPVFKPMHNYLVERKQMTKINQAYSSWEELLFRVPEGSILWPILFDTSLNDLFLVVQAFNFTINADDNIIYKKDESIDDLILYLHTLSKKLLKCFADNQMNEDLLKGIT